MNTPENPPTQVVVSGLLFDWAMSSPAHVDDIEQMKLLLATHIDTEPLVFTRYVQKKQNPELVESLAGCRLFEDDDDVATVIMDSSDDEDDVNDTIRSSFYDDNDEPVLIRGCKLFPDDDI